MCSVSSSSLPFLFYNTVCHHLVDAPSACDAGITVTKFQCLYYRLSNLFRVWRLQAAIELFQVLRAFIIIRGRRRVPSPMSRDRCMVYTDSDSRLISSHSTVVPVILCVWLVANKIEGFSRSVMSRDREDRWLKCLRSNTCATVTERLNSSSFWFAPYNKYDLQFGFIDGTLSIVMPVQICGDGVA